MDLLNFNIHQNLRTEVEILMAAVSTSIIFRNMMNDQQVDTIDVSNINCQL